MNKEKRLLKNIFFLDGYDLKMITIRQILEKERQKFHNKKLFWGASLSEYKIELSKLNNDETPVFIELNLDISTSQNSIIIDHHNQNESKPSSLEQIAELFNIKLNRWQLLVAYNDKGYIPEMKYLCATNEEIKMIRDANRKAQGVTVENEKLAKEFKD